MHFLSHKFRLFIFALILAAVFVSCGTKDSIADLSSQYVTMSDGSRVHYKVCGYGGITLCFVHGFGCDMNVWQKQYEAFANDTIRMIFIDLPGYGSSDKPHTDYTLDYFAQAVKTVVDTVGVHSVFLVGHSLGTPVCRQVVFNYPAIVNALCDIDGVYCFYPTDPAAHKSYCKELESFVNLFHGDACRNNILAFVQTLSGPFTPQDIMDYANSTMPNTPEYVAYSTMSNLVSKGYWTDEKINLPSLVICTRNSGLEPDNKLKMDDLYNDATYVELENTGHFIMMEDAGLVNNLIERCYEKWRMTEL